MKRMMAGSAAIVSMCALLGAHFLKTTRSQEESSIDFVTLTPENDPAMVAVREATANVQRVPAATDKAPAPKPGQREQILQMLKDFRAGKIVRAIPEKKGYLREFYDVIDRTNFDYSYTPENVALTEDLCYSGLAAACQRLAYLKESGAAEIERRLQTMKTESLERTTLEGQLQKLKDEESDGHALACIQGLAQDCYYGNFRDIDLHGDQYKSQLKYFCENGNELFCHPLADLKEHNGVDFNACDGLERGSDAYGACQNEISRKADLIFAESRALRVKGCDAGDLVACSSVLGGSGSDTSEAGARAMTSIVKDCDTLGSSSVETPDYWSNDSSCTSLIRYAREAKDDARIVDLGLRGCDANREGVCYDSIVALARTGNKAQSFSMFKEYCRISPEGNDLTEQTCAAVSASDVLTPAIWTMILNSPTGPWGGSETIRKALEEDKKKFVLPPLPASAQPQD